MRSTDVTRPRPTICAAIERLEGRFFLSAAAAPLSATAALRAAQTYAAMQQYLYRNDATDLYHEQYPVQSGNNPYSYVWPLSQAYTATVDISLLGGYQSDVQARDAALDHYYSQGPKPQRRRRAGAAEPAGI